MEDDFSDDNNDIIASANPISNNYKNQNSSLDQNSTEANNTNGLQNKNLKFDDIPIKPATNNFLELLEKNLENENNYNDYDYSDNVNPKRIIKYEPRKKREIKFDFSKQKKYKYYSQKFDKQFGKDIEALDNYNKIETKNTENNQIHKL